MEEYKKLFFTLILVLFLVFENSVFAYQLSEDEVREMETLDNELCLAKGHNLATEFSIRLYWDCRKTLIDQRIEESYNRGRNKNKFYTTELKRIRKVIDNILTRIESEFTEKLEYYIGKQDRKVELRGKDKYYYNLLKFLSYDYSLYNVNTKKEIKNIIETRQNLKVKKEKINIKDSLEKYPECIVFDIGTKDFTNCINFKFQIEECRKAVLEKLNKKQAENKFKCKQQSIEKYPDYMALYNNEYMELKNEKIDLYNINREKQEQREKRMAELNKLMSGPRLSNMQLINLRKFEEQKCLIDKELENNLFKLAISNECENLLLGAKNKNIKNTKNNNKKEEQNKNTENEKVAEKVIENKEKEGENQSESNNNIGRIKNIEKVENNKTNIENTNKEKETVK